MTSKFFLLLLPLVDCRININIQASTSSNEATIEATGADSYIISDIERGTFKITDKDLKAAVTKYSGGKPSQVYVKSPTPWNDLYQTYNWNEVRRILEPDTARISSVTSQNVIVSKQEFVNNSTVTATFRTGISQEVNDIITNVWKKTGYLTVHQDITYSVSFLAPIGGASRIIYQNLWGEERSERRKVLIGTSAAVDVLLQPGQSVMALLSANRGTLDVEIDYTANLDGDVACNYPKTYRGHHFWAYDINKVLEAAKLPKEVASKEVIRVKFYTDARITVLDRRYNSKLIDIPVDIVISN
ncbi:hypothetical protein K1T71_013805 [Dendrolimus kikuchii]|uniref:Uncharacterized protein n=1 Tax=Dendrolimus kikuchii TaxID=765133 RepID=A0ACC1CFU9_9NEOP|nr:hypothetical protein K1T71_013805 [Dendrolimus kikuchii]